ncbi:MAG: hypothetical protein ABIG84_06940 [archaeon]
MRKITIVIMVVMVAVLFVSGCAQKQTENAPVSDINEPTDGTKPVQPEAAAGAGDTLGQEVSTEITSVDSTDKELQDDDVDNLDTEFENIDW